ncbi:MAG: hypothetical protein Q4C58_15500 [Eubacteriales bacterium]|nr:hypothetical protein [Eubacteriales bacterium]
MSDDLLQRYQLIQMQKSVEARNGKKIKLRWDSPRAVRRSLAKVNNLVVNGELPAKSANAIFYSANLVLKALEMEQALK